MVKPRVFLRVWCPFWLEPAIIASRSAQCNNWKSSEVEIKICSTRTYRYAVLAGFTSATLSHLKWRGPFWVPRRSDLEKNHELQTARRPSVIVGDPQEIRTLAREHSKMEWTMF